MTQQKSDIPYKSATLPQKLSGSHKFNFSCYQGISCYNACCKQADITLTPYDIIRLKNNLKIDSSEFLKTYTVPFEMDSDGMPGVKLRHVEETTQCLLMNESGCSVYEDRPTACRYYPIGQLSLRKSEVFHDEIHYVKIKEDHCQGHQEQTEFSIDQYRQNQEVQIYDELNRTWQQIILKRKSAGPAVGKPSPTSFQFYFLAMFDQDRFRKFMQSSSFLDTYDIPEKLLKQIIKDDLECLRFAYRLLLQVLFGEQTIDLKQEAVKQRIKEREQTWAERKKAEEILYRQKQDQYDQKLDD